MKPPKKILGLFKKAATPPPVEWLPTDRVYPRLAGDISGAPAQPGIYVLWHRGVRPQWLRVGAVRHLASAFTEMANSPAILLLKIDVFVTWALPPVAEHAGIVRFLAETLQPGLQGVAFAWEPITDSVAAPIAFPLPPGTKL